MKKKSIIMQIVFAYILIMNNDYLFSETEKDPFASARRNMIEKDLKGRDISDPVVLKAMEKVKRHLFVDESLQSSAYGDSPLPIGEGQTISQPYIVALMTQSLKLKEGNKVLEIGTGSGYQAAVMAEIVKKVYSIEINEKLAGRATTLLKSLGYGNIEIKAGDGFLGWEKYAPFDAIILTCSINKIPPPLIKQLKEGGKIILPLGGRFQRQTLVLGTKKGQNIEIKKIIPVIFVPMTGEAEK
jgi:protein-L-isoaspartate(D-aspartate) O-methyltransferase